MRWYHYLAYFFGGAFLANALPHLGNGISGHAFQSPFASPPGVGLSSSTVNVLWASSTLLSAMCWCAGSGTSTWAGRGTSLSLGRAFWSCR